MAEYITDMEALPENHPLRTKPLREIGAEYWNKRRAYGGWMQAADHPGVGNFCYNQLNGGWIVFTNWRVKRSDAASTPEGKEK